MLQLPHRDYGVHEIPGFRIVTPRLELRLPTPDDVEQLCAVARSGIHGADFMPFETPWSTLPSPQFEATFHEDAAIRQASLGREGWVAGFAVVANGQPVGMQTIDAGRPTLPPRTRSWLGQAYQGRGYGTEMRAAVLHFAFASLRLDAMRTACADGNVASRRVNEKFGYEEIGKVWRSPAGIPRVSVEFRLEREQYFGMVPRVPIRVEHFELVRHLFPHQRSLDVGFDATRPAETAPVIGI